MTRPLTVIDRLPQVGDVVRRFRTVEVREVAPAAGYAVVWDGRGLSRIGFVAMQGEPQHGHVQHQDHDGYTYWSDAEGRCWTPCYPPYVYLSRADGGRVDWPIDAGSF
jgi:hypothetical protein